MSPPDTSRPHSDSPAGVLRAVSTLAALVVTLTLAAPSDAASPVAVGFVLDGPWERNEELTSLVRREILALTEGELDVRFPADAVRVATWSLDGVHRAGEELLADPSVDLVIALGTLSSHVFCCLGELPKPVVAPLVLDAELQGFPRTGAGSGVRNLVYVALPDGFFHDLETLRRVVPVRHLAVLASGPLLDAVPALRGDGLERAAAAGVRLSRIEVPAPASDSDIETALERIPPDVDGVYLAPLRHLSRDQLDRVIAGLSERRLPSFSIFGETEVRRGVLVGLTPETFYERLARRIALNVQRILLGEEPAEIPVTFPRRDTLVINMRTARQIGVSPRWEVLLEAELLHPVAEGSEEMALERAVDEAIAANLDLEARRRGVAAGTYAVNEARSVLWPRLDASALGVVIDDDRAAASLGARSERSASVGLAATQLLVSDAAWANLEIQRHLQEAREADLEGLRLDVALDAAVAYLDVLRAATLVRVQRNNLDLTRRNLELARVRRDVGAGSPAEVYRWESELATGRKSLVEAHATRRQAEIALLRLLSRDQSQSLEYADVSPDDPELLTGSDRFQALIDTPRRYEAFVELMVDDGLARAPELARFDAAVAAQERTVTAARRAFYAPTLSLAAQLDRLLEEGGAGSDPSLDLFGGLRAPFELPRTDDTSWSLALSGRLPLFEGGARRAERLRAEEELRRIRLERRAVEERLTQGIRTALEAARGSYPGIELSRQAADAAARNLELVSDAYARGAVSVLDLLDAQNAAFNAEELAANAAYDFLVDLMRAERAASRFDFFLTPGERDAWYGRLEDRLRRWGLAVEVPREGGS